MQAPAFTTSLVTADATFFLTIDELRSAVGIYSDTSVPDIEILEIGRAAMDYISRLLGRHLIKRDWVDYYPCPTQVMGLSVQQVGSAPIGTANALTALKAIYADTDGVAQTIVAPNYMLDLTAKTPRVIFAEPLMLTDLNMWIQNPFKISYTFDPLVQINDRAELKVMKQCAALLAKAIFQAKTIGEPERELAAAERLLQPYRKLQL